MNLYCYKILQISLKKISIQSYYTLTQLMKNSVLNINKYVLKFTEYIIENYKDKINKANLIKNALNNIEKNKLLVKFNDMKLYNHQIKSYL